MTRRMLTKKRIDDEADAEETEDSDDKTDADETEEPDDEADADEEERIG